VRIVHFSDTHLGFSEFGRLDSATGLNAREVDVYDAFERAIQTSIELKPDLAIHAGDLFHTPRPSNRAIFKGLEGLKKLVDAGIPTIVIAGNHSTPRVLSSGFIFETSNLLGIHAVYGSQIQVLHIGDAAVHCVPHLPTTQALRETLGNLKPDPHAKYNVLVMHAGVRGTGEEYSLGEFNEILLNQETIANLRDFDYIALGHYHRHLQVAPNAYYSGSTERFSFREAGYEKGVFEVDLATRKHKFHPIACREMVLLKPINCRNKNAAKIIDEVEALLKGAAPLDNKILRLTFEQLHPTTWFEIDQKQIRQWAAGAFELRIEKTFVETDDSQEQVTSIGGLAGEFSAFINRAKLDGLSKERMRSLGEDYLRRAEEEEAE
jgi:DNA repair protein SbcD/Mre11